MRFCMILLPHVETYLVIQFRACQCICGACACSNLEQHAQHKQRWTLMPSVDKFGTKQLVCRLLFPVRAGHVKCVFLFFHAVQDCGKQDCGSELVSEATFPALAFLWRGLLSFQEL